MNLAHAFRLDGPLASNQIVSLVGAGGKSTALFQIARSIGTSTVIVTATSHLGAWQIPNADHHIIAKDSDALKAVFGKTLAGVILVTGPIENDRTLPIDEHSLSWLREESKRNGVPLLIEADGSRGHPLKAPAAHEPPIPTFTNTVIVVAGLSALNKPLNNEYVHRADIYSQLAQTPLNQTITPETISRALIHPQGGLKNIPPTARRVALLNQADAPELQSIGGSMARQLLDDFDSVIVASLESKTIQTIERTAGIILAAGESKRFGGLKQLLDWRGKPFVKQVAETALHAGLWPVAAVTGFRAAEVDSALSGLSVSIVHNSEYSQGQSTSIKAGIQFLSSSFNGIGSVIFLLADQPQIPPEVIRALTESHSLGLPAILAPLVLEERRANPVLLDKVTFPDLLQLIGDVGGRAIFDKHRVEYLPWYDDILLFDVDKPEDYQRMKELE